MSYTRYVSIVRGKYVIAHANLVIFEDPNEYEIKDFLEEIRDIFENAKAGDAAPVSVPSGADNA